MRAFTESLHPTSTRVEQKKSIFLPKTLNDCTYIFIKDDPIHPNLCPAYSGPYLVIDRNNDVFKAIKRGKLISVGINNVKPGFIHNISNLTRETEPIPDTTQSSSLLPPQPRPRTKTVFPQQLRDCVVNIHYIASMLIAVRYFVNIVITHPMLHIYFNILLYIYIYTVFCLYYKIFHFTIILCILSSIFLNC